MDQKPFTVRKLFISQVILFGLLVLFVVANRVDQRVVFADRQLETAVRESLGYSEKVLYKTDLLGIYWLDASGRDITNLSGIEQLPKLVALNLNHNSIESLYPLQKLRMLEELRLRNNNIQSLEKISFKKLSGLSLRKLDLRDNDIECIELLSAFTGLVYLNLHSNARIHSIQPLHRLRNLETLILRNVYVGEQVDVLKNMTDLKRVNLRNTQISDVGYMEHSENLVAANQAVAIPPPVFSRIGGFYNEPFTLILSHPDPDVKIIYTLDGSEPDIGNIGAGSTYLYKNSFPGLAKEPFGVFIEDAYQTLEYSAPLIINDRSAEPNRLASRITTGESKPRSWHFAGYIPSIPVFKGTSVRAIAVNSGKIPSEVVTQVYYVTEEGFERYSLPVVSISTSGNVLFDYEVGIYSPGIDFDRWRADNPDVDAVDWIGRPWRIPANFTRRGREWEKPVHLQLFSKDGMQLANQNAGIRIHGGDTRSFSQKSVRLYARSGYGSETLNLPFPSAARRFPVVGAGAVSVFKRLILASGYNHQDAVSTKLMAPAAIDVQSSTPIVQFINGEYWGIVFATTRLDRFLFSRRYSICESNVVMIDNPRGERAHVDEGHPEDISLYQAFRHSLLENNPASPAYYGLLESLMDVDSFIDMHLMFVYLNNPSWHGRIHFKYWRAREQSEHPYEDGRWRFMVWDFDHFIQDPAFDYLGQLLDPEAGGLFLDNPEATQIFRHVIINEQFRQRFIDRLLHHMHFTFSPERVEKVADEVYMLLAPECAEHESRWGYRLYSDGRSNEQFRAFGTARPGYVREHMREHFGLGYDVELEIINNTPWCGVVLVNEALLDGTITPGVDGRPKSWRGLFFEGLPVTLTALPDRGHRFVRWDGIDSDAPQITFNMTGDHHVAAVFEIAPEEELLYYWSFNDQNLLPTYSISGGHLYMNTTDASEIIWEPGQGIEGQDSRMDNDTGAHLRVNSPRGVTLDLTLPTVGYECMVLEYEASRSADGPSIHYVAYTIDSQNYKPIASFFLNDKAPETVAVDFTAYPETFNNPLFGVRIGFVATSTAGGNLGNVRLDKIALKGVPSQRSAYVAKLPNAANLKKRVGFCSSRANFRKICGACPAGY